MTQRQSWSLLNFLNARDDESLAEKRALDEIESGAHSGFSDSLPTGSTLIVPSLYQALAAPASVTSTGEEISPSKPSNPKKQKVTSSSPKHPASSKAMDQLESKLDKLLQGQAEAKKELDDFRKEERDFKTEFGTFRKNVEEQFVQHGVRLHAVESIAKNMEKKVDDIALKQSNQGKHLVDFDGRLVTLETQQKQLFANARNAGRPTDSAPKTKDQLLQIEMNRLDDMEAHTARVRHTIVMGPKPHQVPMSRTELDGFLGSRWGNMSFSVSTRGTNGVFAIRFFDMQHSATTAGVNAVDIATDFLDSFNSRFNPDNEGNLWANYDMHQLLREALGRARNFGKFYKIKHKTAFWRISNNILVVNEIVIGPVTILPGSSHWPKLAGKITKAKRSRFFRSITFDRSLASQVKERIFIYCAELKLTPGFLEDMDQGDESDGAATEDENEDPDEENMEAESEA